MYFNNLLIGLTLGLFSIFKVKAKTINECDDIYHYLQVKGHGNNYGNCTTNSVGEVKEINLYPFCLDSEILGKIFTYKTIETLNFNAYVLNNNNIENLNLVQTFGCSEIPSLTNENFNSLPNLKNLSLYAMTNLDVKSVLNIPKSVTNLKLGETTLSQDITNGLAKLKNLETLNLIRTIIPDETDFYGFKKLTNFTTLNMDCTKLTLDRREVYDEVKGNFLKYCRSLKKLYIKRGIFSKYVLDKLSYMTALEELEFYYAEFSVDATIRSFKNLTNLTSLTIHCSGRPLNRISSGLFYLTKLKYLKLRGLNRSKISVTESLTFSNLKNLEILDLSDNGPVIKLNYIDGLPNLRELYLKNDFYSIIPNNFGNLKSLEILDLSGNDITTIPEAVCNLVNLKKLYLKNNRLTSLPSEICNLVNLTELDVYMNSLTTLPENIGKCNALQSLDVSNNRIASLPSSIGDLTNLTYADFSVNVIEEIPESICNLRKLTVFLFTMNRIEKIPENIGNMESLTSIELSFNEITKFPSTIGELKNLETLKLNGNSIDDYPESLNNLPNLNVII